MQMLRVVVPRAGAEMVERAVEHADDLCRLVADDLRGVLIPKNGNRGASGVVWVAAFV